ncbi:MAG: S41 family peptidase [Deferrisomatales bacterium]|nr:S41 family peptidase [Deferrisomatales bacterium]
MRRCALLPRLPVLALALFAVVALPGGGSAELSPEARDELYRRLRVLAEALDVVQRDYVEEISPEDLVHGAVQGIVSRLDPHSSFLSPDLFREMQVDTEGAFGGLGIEVSVREGKLTVVSPIEGTPAAAAGILAGDVIVMIEEEPTQDMELMEAVRRMRGPRGTQVTIHVMREGFEKPRAFTLVRDIIRIHSVRARRLGELGLIRIVQFQQGTHGEVREALGGLAEEGPLSGLILDLRNDPGGLLDQAVKVADLFLKGGTVVSTRGRDPEQEVVYAARDDGDEPDFPMVVLVNEGSASASEIVAGALQDHRRALILGERTFGKGSVQTILPLSDGSGLRVTTALYYTPSGRSIQAKGIVPDVHVPSGAVLVVQPRSPHGQTREEDLKGHFEKDGAGDGDAEADGPGGAPDLQLERAVEILEGWRIFQSLRSAPAGEVSAGNDAQ